MLLVGGLFAVSVLAGLIDAIAGGGGLLTVPALVIAGFDPLTALATNKLQSTFGSGSATLTFARAGHLERSSWPVAVASALGAVVGALALSSIPRDLAMTGLPVLLVAVAIYFALSPRMTEHDRARRMAWRPFLITVVPLIGFYDGVFGPGTGSFFMLAFVELLGFGLYRAAAHTKLANFASNFAALATLALSGHIVWGLGLVMGVGQFLGARMGAGLTMRHGAKLVRPLVVTMCCILALRLALAPTHPIGRWLVAHWGG